MWLDGTKWHLTFSIAVHVESRWGDGAGTHVWVHENLLRNYQKSHKNHKMFNFCLFESSDIFNKNPGFSPFLPVLRVTLGGSRRRLLLSWFNTGSGTNMTNWEGSHTLDAWNPISNHPGWCWNPINNGKIMLRLVVFPVIYKVLYIPGGAGFQPSTVGAFFLTHFGGVIKKKQQIYTYIYISQSGRKQSPPETRCLVVLRDFPI